MTTYRRFNCVERSIAMFLAQDYTEETELIMYNTDVDYPLSLDNSFEPHKHKIKVINNNIDFETKKEYTNVGAIRRDALTFASGDYYITWDDDDLFFPWNIRMCMDGLNSSGKSSWKPKHSFMKHLGHEPTLVYNNMEASILTKMEKIHEFGFDLSKTGAEHLGWLENLKRTNDILEDENSIPGYCFYWSDIPEIAGHKQSNNTEFVRPDNFQRHKEFTTDYATRPFTLQALTKYEDVFIPFSNHFKEFKIKKSKLYNDYIKPNYQLLFPSERIINKQLPIEYINKRREYIIFKNDCGVTDHVKTGTIYEAHIFKYIRDNLNVLNTTIIDIGANLGFHTLEFADMVGPKGEVVSFEPQKLIYYQLCGNIMLNGFKNVTAHNIALSDENTILKMENLQYTSDDTINIGNAHLDAWTQTGHNLVTVKKLDDYKFVEQVSIIKVDVQGYEPKVLDGAINTINTHRPIIFIEIEQDQLSIYGKTEDDVLSRLRNLTYKIEKIGAVDYVALP